MAGKQTGERNGECRYSNYGLMDDYIYFEMSSGDYTLTTLEGFFDYDIGPI